MKNTLIIGWNSHAVNLYEKIRAFPALGYTIKGFISLNNHTNGKHYEKMPLLGNIDVLEENIKKYSIRELLICIEPTDQSKLEEVFRVCKDTGTNLRIISDVYNIIYGKATRDVFREIFKPKEISVRRLCDFLGALVLMCFLLPIFSIIAVAIKIESKGSIFISQVRIGKDGKRFRIYKFRSMHTKSEQKDKPFWTEKDPGLTKVGTYLRQTRMDELPQILNVLKGDMSLIGPEPEGPLFVDSIKDQIPIYNSRFRIKPGMTGWAQVNWDFDETIDDIEEQLKYDIQYINIRSFKMDYKIMYLTMKKLFSVDMN